MRISDDELTRILTKTAFLGLMMNILVPATLFAILVIFRGGGISEGSLLPTDRPELTIVFYACLAVSAAGVSITYLLRRAMPASIVKGKNLAREFESRVLAFSIITFALNESYAVVGMVLSLLGMSREVFLLFISLTMITYQVFRPRRAFLEQLRDKLEGIPAETTP